MFKSSKDFGGFWVNAVKDFKGHEGEPLTQCNVLFNGKKVGFFSEDSWGGPAHLDISDKKIEKALMAEAAKLSDWSEAYHEFVLNICEAVDTIKWYKRRCGKAVLFRTPDMKDGAFRQLKGHKADDPRVRQWLKEKYPNAIVINDELKKVA